MRRNLFFGALGLATIATATVTLLSQPEPSRQTVYRFDNLQIIVDTNTDYSGERAKNLMYVGPDPVFCSQRWKIVGLDYDGDSVIDRTYILFGNVPSNYSDDVGLTQLLKRAKSSQTLSDSIPGKVPSAR